MKQSFYKSTQQTSWLEINIDLDIYIYKVFSPVLKHGSKICVETTKQNFKITQC